MRRTMISLLVVLVVAVVAAMAGAGAGPSKEATSDTSAEVTSTDNRQVVWLRDGCRILVEDNDPEGETIDYWAAVCHGYAIAARDYIQIVMAFAQKLEDKPLEVCIESDDVTGRDIARVFVDYVDQHPGALDRPAPLAMLSAVTERWCPGLKSQGT